MHKLLFSWQTAAIVKFEDQMIMPVCPIMTDEDLGILNPWFQYISKCMCAAVSARLDEYRALAINLAGGKYASKQEMDNILTIQICAQTLDSWVFSWLREKLIGSYPPRDSAGNFFFWGYAFASGPQRIFGFTTYGGFTRQQLHMIRSHGLDREAIKAALSQRDSWDFLYSLFSRGLLNGETAQAEQQFNDKIEKAISILKKVGLLRPEDPPRLAIPAFTDRYMESAVTLYRTISEKIAKHFIADIDEINALANRCSFAKCSRSDVLCMLFHLAYSYAADELVEREIIPAFPASAGGEWGVWIH
jgi:hypothetical protein